MDIGIPEQPGEPKRGRSQLETRGLHSEALQSPDGQLHIRLSGQRFPSLQLWDFGLMPKAGVSFAQIQALTEKINELCDGAYASFHSDREMDGWELYERDEWGLAKLE
jgi:hypothetical protein